MLAEIIEQLKTGSISNVILFGSSNDPLPSTPYVCVKPESYQSGRGIRIIVHYDLGNNDALDDYIYNELSTLLKDYEYTDSNDNTVIIKDAEEYSDIVADNDDSTISMERLFYIPLRLR